MGARPAGNFQLEVVPLFDLWKVGPASMSPDPLFMISLARPYKPWDYVYETNQDRV